MPALTSWYVKKGVNSYLTNNSDCSIKYKCNDWQEADITFDITNTA